MIVNYVTYLPDGTLDGGYVQEIPSVHQNRYIIVSDQVRLNWPLYRANAARDGVELIPPAPPPPMDEMSMWWNMRNEADRVAQAFGYPSMDCAATFAHNPNFPRLQADGQILEQWRGQLWDGVYTIIANARAGLRTRPTSTAELMAELPAAPVPTPSAQIPQ